MVRGYFSENCTGNIQIIEGRISAEKYQYIFNSNLNESAAKQELSNKLIFQQDNDPTHIEKSTKKLFFIHDIEQLE